MERFDLDERRRREDAECDLTTARLKRQATGDLAKHAEDYADDVARTPRTDRAAEVQLATLHADLMKRRRDSWQQTELLLEGLERNRQTMVELLTPICRAPGVFPTPGVVPFDKELVTGAPAVTSESLSGLGEEIESEDVCEALSPFEAGTTNRWICTLAPGHEGEHRAVGFEADHPSATWPAESAGRVCGALSNRPPPAPRLACSLLEGHAGEHKAVGFRYDDGAPAWWSDKPEESTVPCCDGEPGPQVEP